jgi:hypothetical protein
LGAGSEAARDAVETLVQGGVIFVGLRHSRKHTKKAS